MAEFNIPTRVATTALTTVSTVGAIATARLVAGAANVTASIHDTTGTTAAGTRVATLAALANTDTELAVPVRCKNGVKVVLSAATGQLYVYIR